MTVWITAWQSDQDAQGFFRVYQSVLEQSHRLRFHAHDGGDREYKRSLPAGQSTLLQIKGKFVLLLDGAAATRADHLATRLGRISM